MKPMPPIRTPVRLFMATIVGLGGLWCLAPGPARGQDAAEGGTVYGGGERERFPIAVMPFKPETPLLSDVISHDLILSGFFRPPENPAFAEETHKLDEIKGNIDFAEWFRIGVYYLVKGQYSVVNDELVVEVRTFDTVSGRFIFGNRYLNTPVKEARRLAHRISNDIIKRVTGYTGAADTHILCVRQLDLRGSSKQVTLIDADGHDLRPLTPEGELTATPAWGASGTEVYYTTYRDFNPDLAGLILRTNQSWWVSRRSGFNLSANWCEKLKKLALTLTKDGNSEIYVIDRQGKSQQRLTNNQAIDAAPAWSRDGSRMAFTSDRGGSPQIYLMEVDSRKSQRLTYHSRYNDGADWSPAGPERIAFCSRIDGFFHIFTVDPDGKNLRQLTRGSHNNEDPSWAPNGMMLTFTSDRSGRKHIYTLFAVDGSNVHQLTRGVPCHSPAWSPAVTR